MAVHTVQLWLIMKFWTLKKLQFSHNKFPENCHKIEHFYLLTSLYSGIQCTRV